MNPVSPYAGLDQQTRIVIPKTISSHQEREEGCWVLPNYSAIFPETRNIQNEETQPAFLPPPIQTTDLWSAMQTYPL